MWQFELRWLSERDGDVAKDTGRATGEEISAWVAAIDKAHAEKDLTAEVRIPTANDSDWSDGTVPALRVKKIKVVGGPSYSWQ